MSQRDGPIDLTHNGAFDLINWLRLGWLVCRGSTVSPDTANAQSTWNKGDRTAYLLAARAPWLFRGFMANMARKLRRDPDSWRDLLLDLSPADQRTLTRDDSQALMRRMLTEALRQGPRGLAHDYRLEATPWGLDLAAIHAPVDIWHGQDDTLVKPVAARLLADAIPGARLRLVPGQGHFSLIVDEPTRHLSTTEKGHV